MRGACGILMTWEQKLAAMQGLCEHSLKMRKPGDWYVLANGLEVSDGKILAGEYGNGETPEAAVNDHWEKYVSVRYPKSIVLHAHTERRREVIWNGYMWEDALARAV